MTGSTEPAAGSPVAPQSIEMRETEIEDDPQNQAMSPGKAYLRIFTYANSTDIFLESVAVAAAIGSGTALALVNLVFGTYITVLTGYVSGTIPGDEFLQQSSKYCLYFVYIGIARWGFAYIYTTLTTYVAYKIVRNIRRHYLKAALSQEIAFFDKGTNGSISMQATSNGSLIQSGISEKLGLCFQALATFIAAFIVAFISQWKLTLILMCIAPALILLMLVIGGLEASIETDILAVLAQAGSYAESVLSTPRLVHAFEIRKELVSRYDKFLFQARQLGDRKRPIWGFLFSLEFCIIYAGMGLAFWQGVKMLANGEVESLGTVFTVIMSVIVATTSFTLVAPYTIAFMRAASAASSLFVLIDRKSKINPFDEKGEKPSKTEGRLQLNGVNFSYPTRPGIPVLQDFSLDVPAGKVTALVGPSGSGKSTIVGLIERWYEINSGCISLDGRPIESLNLNWLRTNVRLVQQEPVLFNGTVFENIARGLVGTPWENSDMQEQQKRVEDAARFAFAHDFIIGLPEGYSTRVGERGGLLSGGQKQRVAIARSIIAEPKILLLDEATSALDPHAEGIVQKALDNVSKSRTTIIIAHKLATIKDADNIVVMSKGRIVEQGSHQSLLAVKGTYYRLVEAQNLAVSAESGSHTGELSASDDDETPKDANLETTRTMTRYETDDRKRLECLSNRDSYEGVPERGLFVNVMRLVCLTPQLKWWYVVVLVDCILASGIFPAQAVLLARIMGVFELPPDLMREQGNFYALMFFVVGLCCLFVYFTMGWATATTSQALNQKMRRNMLGDMLRQDVQFFDRPENTTGALTGKLDSIAQAVLELMGFNIALVFSTMLSVLASSILAIVVSWKLGLVGVLAGMPPLVGAGYIRIRLEARMDRETQKRFSGSAAIASESILAIRTVSSLAIEDSVVSAYDNELHHAIRSSIFPLVHMMFWFAFTQAIEYFILALGFWWGCKLVVQGELTFYQFFVSFIGVFFAGQNASLAFGYTSSITKGASAANYFFWLRSLQPTVQETEENRERGPRDDVKSIELRDTKFSYPLRSDNRVLKGVDLNISRGQFVALVGASGCGKSTMVALLERFYDPSAGRLAVDGESLSSLNPKKYRANIALVQQEPTLYQGTIRENVLLGRAAVSKKTPGMGRAAAENFSPVTEKQRSKEATVNGEDNNDDDGRVEAALRAANAWEFVSSLPEGTGTLCGSSGSQLSGGQRQRVAIARALIREPNVLLLDEATSALDTESERVVQRALAAAREADPDRVTVAVAHRLSTVREADRICVFHGGRIVETGTHTELLSLKGMYAKMCEAQSLDR